MNAPPKATTFEYTGGRWTRSLNPPHSTPDCSCQAAIRKRGPGPANVNSHPRLGAAGIAAGQVPRNCATVAQAAAAQSGVRRRATGAVAFRG